MAGSSLARATRGRASATALAKLLRVTETRAEFLLAELSLEDVEPTTSEVEGAHTAKLRVPAAASPTEDALEQRSEVELGAHKP